MTCRIETLPAAAAEPLALLHAACFPEEPWDTAAMGRILRLAGCFGLVAWQAGAPAGFVLARDLGGECEILSLGVCPRSRRQGIGRDLLAALSDAAAQRGSAAVVLEVAVDNAPARRLYAATGFVVVGRRPRYYARPTGLADALILRRIPAREEQPR